MTQNEYPVFDGGQTLTASDLNLMREFLHDRDAAVARMVGFGISCGLTGSVSGPTVTIAPGLAIDQNGEPLVLTTPRSMTLPPAATTSFDFVTAGPGGYSVVLDESDLAESAPECGQTDCGGHAQLHARSVEIQLAVGRIAGPRFDFANESLLAVTPMRLSLTSSPIGDFNALRDAIATRLANSGSPLIAFELITKLRSTSIEAADLPGVKGYKAGFINQVLFATLDLLRCRALMNVACARTTATPGVVLGWVHQVGGTWTWDCGYRHAWEPPTGLSQAIAGGTCADPCRIYRDELEGLISGYAPPEPVAAGDEDEPPDLKYCPIGMILVNGVCVNVYYPPEFVGPDWHRRWTEVEQPNLVAPIWNPDPTRSRVDDIIQEVYQQDTWEFFGEGVLNGAPVLGRTERAARESLESAVLSNSGTPNVVFVTQDQAQTYAGYEPAGSFNLADTMVLTVGTVNGVQVVTATGRVPAAYTARQLGTQLPAATAKATQALSVAQSQAAGVKAMTEKVGELAKGVDSLTAFQESTVTWRGTVDSALGGVHETIAATVKELVGTSVQDMDKRVARVEGSIDMLAKVRIGTAPGSAPAQRLDVDFARGMVEFAETVYTGLATLVTEENQKTLGRYVGDATRAAADLAVVAAAGEPVAIGEAAVQLMSTLRTAVKATGIDRSFAKQLDTQFNAVKGLLG